MIVACLLVVACTSEPGQLSSSAEPGSGALAESTSSTSDSGATTSTTEAAPDAEPPSADPDDAFTVTPVDWRDCDSGMCAELEVPLDHANPTGATITIAMAGLPATGSADERIGTVFVNFGGPGGEGTETIASFGPLIPTELRDRFDFVSWDPRGVEDTAGLGCDGEIGDEPTKLVSDDAGFNDDVVNDRLVWSRVMDCVANSPIVDELGTVAVARDLDLMRQAVGDERLNYLGFSYGTKIGWVHATLFPDTVRSMVLDGAVPPFDGLVDQTFGQLTTIEAAIDRYDQGCEQAPDCEIADEGFRNTVLRVMLDLEANPIPLDDGTLFGPVDLGNMMVTMTYLDPEDWGSVFASVVADLDRGDVQPIQGLANLFEGGSETALFWAVLCADGDAGVATGEYAALYERAYNEAPFMGRLPGGIFCDSYPGEIDVLPALDTTGTPPLLVIGSTGDNATPYVDAVRLDGLLADSTLLTYDGPGHTITFFDECIDGHVTDYFVDGVLPPDGTRCGNPSTVGDGWFVPIEE